MHALPCGLRRRDERAPALGVRVWRTRGSGCKQDRRLLVCGNRRNRRRRSLRPECFIDAPVRDLIGHIVDAHHRPLEKELPRLLLLARRAARVHGRQAPCLEILQALVIDLAEELVSHVEKEEQILFPWILRSSPRPSRRAASRPPIRRASAP